MSGTDAIAGTRRAVRELVDGTLRVTIDVDPQYRREFWQLLPDIDMPVALAALRINGETRTLKQNGPYSHEAQQLYMSHFFSSLMVARAVGTDDEYLSWLREQPCINCGAEPPNEAAHVRRVKDGAGMGIKPPYSAITLCRSCHHEQHQRGESVLGSKLQVEELRDRQRHQWGWEVMKVIFGYEHWYDVPPAMVLGWAQKANVAEQLPQAYRDA